MSSSLGSNLSELDRLLLELNAVQHNPPGFPADEANSSPPLPGALSTHYGVPENNSLLGGKAGPLTKEKPKRNGGRGLEDLRPSVENLLDELESSVPSPVPTITVNQGEMSSPQRVTSSQQQTRISASSATRELDELMASLSDFKFMAQGKTGSSSPPGGPPKPGSQLDSMLGSLQSDLNKLGVATVAKGVCGACKKPIAGQVVTAMGKTWHPEHFVCTHCQEEIGSRNFFERDGQPYCEKDYHNLFSPRCYYCNGPILDGSTRKMARPTAARITLTCSRPSVAAAPGPSWRTTSRPSTPSGTPSALCVGSASRRSSTAASLSTRGSPTARRTTTSGGARCARAARSPSRAAASPPWPRSSTPSTSSAPSASSSSTRAPSRSRTTSLTVRTAFSSSSARRPRPSPWPLPWPSLLTAAGTQRPRPGGAGVGGGGEGANPTETGTVSSAMVRGH
nr:paxillin isoform X2 [Bubalus bubalis]